MRTSFMDGLLHIFNYTFTNNSIYRGCRVEVKILVFVRIGVELKNARDRIAWFLVDELNTVNSHFLTIITCIDF